MRFRRALDRGNVTEALSAASELQFVSLAEALELTLLLADREREKYERAAFPVASSLRAGDAARRPLREPGSACPPRDDPANRLAAAALAELLSGGDHASESWRR